MAITMGTAILISSLPKGMVPILFSFKEMVLSILIPFDINTFKPQHYTLFLPFLQEVSHGNIHRRGELCSPNLAFPLGRLAKIFVF